MQAWFWISRRARISVCSSGFPTMTTRGFSTARRIVPASARTHPRAARTASPPTASPTALNLRGPSIAMDTACSSALTAVHVACEHILAGRCKAAMAGGVTVMITPDGFIGFSQAGMLSPEGKCKAFDASANGFVAR